jgi:hypothetical protein
MRKKVALSPSMTQTEFDNGYWYATDLKEFAVKVGIPSAGRLRKDELERALSHFIRTGEATMFARRALTKSARRDVDIGLALDLPIVSYTSNKETKAFIEREAREAPAWICTGLRDALPPESLARGSDRRRPADHLPRPGHAGHSSQPDETRAAAGETWALHQFHLRFLGRQPASLT